MVIFVQMVCSYSLACLYYHGVFTSSYCVCVCVFERVVQFYCILINSENVCFSMECKSVHYVSKKMCDEDTQTLRRFTLGFDRFSAVPINRNLLGCFAVESPLFANNWRTTLYVLICTCVRSWL